MIINSDDLLFIKEQPLWTGCRVTPYLMRCGILIDQCLIYVTDLRKSWFCKLSREQILKDKDIFNKQVQTQSFDGVLDLLRMALQYDPQAEYTYKLNDDSIFYGYSNIIKIYTLAWVFDCKQINQDQHFNILATDIISPMMQTITSLERRVLYFRQSLGQIEREYCRRLNEKEKQQYKTKDVDDDLATYIVEDKTQKENHIFPIVDFTPAANYFIKYYSANKLLKQQQALKRQIQEPKKVIDNKKDKLIATYEEALNDMFDKPEPVNDPKKPKQKKLGFF